MPDKDLVIAAGVILTAVIGLANLAYGFRHNRRASYVASVTATRLSWIGIVRDKLSRFVALHHELKDCPPAAAEELQKVHAEILQLRTALRMHLAPQEADLDRQFDERVEGVYAARLEGRTADLDGLVRFGQDFLWKEWRKVKSEAIHGDPYDSLPRRAREVAKAWLAPLE